MGSSELDDFNSFYRRTYAAAYRTALGVTSSRSLAEDATQEAYASAYRDRRSFRADAPAEHWLQRIVVRKGVDQLRRRGNRPTLELTDEVEAEASESSVVVQRLALLAALNDLQPRQRAAIVLRYFHDYSYRAVGEVLGTSEGGATMVVQRALGRLRERLGDEMEASGAGLAAAARTDEGGAT
ncbi:MAG: RNA polymerase sigma factor [Candidatus Limnocylindrales bacterium]